MHKVTGIRCYSQDFTKKLSSIFGKCIQYVGLRIDFYRKKPSQPLQNTLFYALVSIKCGGKPLITTNKLAGPVGKKGILGGVYRLRNTWKTTKKITEPVTKWVNSKRCVLNRGVSPMDPPWTLWPKPGGFAPRTPKLPTHPKLSYEFTLN